MAVPYPGFLCHDLNETRAIGNLIFCSLLFSLELFQFPPSHARGLGFVCDRLPLPCIPGVDAGAGRRMGEEVGGGPDIVWFQVGCRPLCSGTRAGDTNLGAFACPGPLGQFDFLGYRAVASHTLADAVDVDATCSSHHLAVPCRFVSRSEHF